jgi:hypothetical protein
MRSAHRAAGALLDTVGLAMLVAGPVLVARGLTGRRDIRSELAAQRINFPEDERMLPTEIVDRAGHRVETGQDARDYAQLIKANLSGITGGRTYSEVTAQLHDGAEDDEKLVQLRQTAFMGETLRASLLSAYQAWETTKLVTCLGVLSTGLGAALLARSRAGIGAGSQVCRGDLDLLEGPLSDHLDDLLDQAASARDHRG